MDAVGCVALVAMLLLVVALRGRRRRSMQVGPPESCRALVRWNAAVVTSPSEAVHGMNTDVHPYTASKLRWLSHVGMHLHLYLFGC